MAAISGVNSSMAFNPCTVSYYSSLINEAATVLPSVQSYCSANFPVAASTFTSTAYANVSTATEISIVSFTPTDTQYITVVETASSVAEPYTTTVQTNSITQTVTQSATIGTTATVTKSVCPSTAAAPKFKRAAIAIEKMRKPRTEINYCPAETRYITVTASPAAVSANPTPKTYTTEIVYPSESVYSYTFTRTIGGQKSVQSGASTSTKLITSTIVICPDCKSPPAPSPAPETITTEIVYTTTTFCPYSSTQISGGKTSVWTGTTTSTLLVTSTITTCPACQSTPTFVPTSGFYTNSSMSYVRTTSSTGLSSTTLRTSSMTASIGTSSAYTVSNSSSSVMSSTSSVVPSTSNSSSTATSSSSSSSSSLLIDPTLCSCIETPQTSTVVATSTPLATITQISTFTASALTSEIDVTSTSITVSTPTSQVTASTTTTTTVTVTIQSDSTVTATSTAAAQGVFVQNQPEGGACGCEFDVYCGYGANSRTVERTVSVLDYQECLNTCDSQSNCYYAVFDGTTNMCSISTSYEGQAVGTTNSILVIKNNPGSCATQSNAMCVSQ